MKKENKNENKIVGYRYGPITRDNPSGLYLAKDIQLVEYWKVNQIKLK